MAAMRSSALRVRETVAFVTLTVTASAIFTDARCPACNRIVMLVPGVIDIEVRSVQGPSGASGEHRVVPCKRCGSYCEVREHA